MVQFLTANNAASMAFQLDDVYIIRNNPPGAVAGVPASVGVVVGTATWGKPNRPYLCGGPADVVRSFGDITAASLSDVHDLPRDMKIAFAQGSYSTLMLWGIRVTDGTDVAAQVTLEDNQGSPVAGGIFPAIWTGSNGNNLQIVISAGPSTNSFNVTVVGPAGSQTEQYLNVAGSASGPSPFWQNFANALAQGVPGFAGPSQLLGAVQSISVTAHNPALGTFALSGGTDGRSVTSSQLVGSNSIPPTGLYAIQSQIPKPSMAWIAGLSDSTQYANLQALADSEGFCVGLTFPVGDNTAAKIALVQTTGVVDTGVAWFGDWVQFQDPINNRLYLNSPLPFACGMIASLAPHQYPGNKPLYQIVGTERYNYLTGTVPYGNAELGQLEAAGINVPTNNIPAGGWGLRMGVNASNNPAQNGINWTRLTNWIEQSLGDAGALGQLVGQLQSTQPHDRVRSHARHLLNNFFQTLKQPPNAMINDYLVTCDLSNNPVPRIQAGFLAVDCLVSYLKEVRFFEIRNTGGPTVVTSQNALTAQLPVAA